MKCMIIFVAVLAVALAQAGPQVNIVKEGRSESVGDGNYEFNYELSDGSSRQETGSLKDLPDDEPGSVMRGSYSFVGTDGVTYTVTYVADENGFRAEGAHLPK